MRTTETTSARDDEVPDHGGYKRWLTTDQGSGWLASVADQTEAWLRDKHMDADLARDTTTRFGARTLRVRHHHKDGADALRVVLEEDNSGSHWSTTVLAVEGASGGWVALRVLNDHRRIAKAPWLAARLLDVVPLSDGGRAMGRAPAWRRRAHRSARRSRPTGSPHRRRTRSEHGRYRKCLSMSLQ